MNPAILYGHLTTISKTIGQRPTGSLANRQVMEYIGKFLECLEYPVTYQLFNCLDWSVQNVSCSCAGRKFQVIANPYSPPCNVTASWVFLKNIEELRGSDLTGTIAVLSGELVNEPLMPKNFPFYQPVEHQEIIRLLEEKKPDAVLFVCSGDVVTPLCIDGDFLIPSGTMDLSKCSPLFEHHHDPLNLIIETDSSQTRAANVMCQIPGQGKKIILCAHFDSKYYTPGALDNASGVAALMVLADRLRRSPPPVPLEFVFFNGEECYNIPGEMAYFDAGEMSPETVRLAINIDGIGLSGYLSSIAYFSCPPDIEIRSEEARKKYTGVTRVDPWPQGDHMIFALKDIPAIAFSTSVDWVVIEKIIHTPSDTMDRLDIGRIMHTVDAIDAIVRNIAGS